VETFPCDLVVSHPQAQKHDSARPPPLRLCAAVITQESLSVWLAVCICQRRLPKRATLFLGGRLALVIAIARPVSASKITYGVLWLWKRAHTDAHSHKEPICACLRALTVLSLKSRFLLGWQCALH
jgi:hypothetical protein